MCGRFVASASAEDIAEAMGVEEIRTDNLGARYNVAPTVDIYTVANRTSGCRAVGAMRWGLVPSWAKSPNDGARHINARAETVHTSKLFGKAFERRRCLVPADGFYEWERRSPKDKQPWYFAPANMQLLAFAGIWEVWREPGATAHDSDGGWLRTCSIITTSANSTLSSFHDRMPAVLPSEDWELWLDRETDPSQAHLLLRPAQDDLLEGRPVDKAVNSVKNDGPWLIASP